MYKTELTRAGLKLYSEKGKHVKTIPSRYESFVGIVDFGIEKKRLTGKERFNFEHAYFLKLLEKTEKYVWELIKDAKPEKAYPVQVHDGSKRYEMLYDNGRKIKIDTDLYQAFEYKDENTHFSNY